MTRKQAIRTVLAFLDESPELDENLCKAKMKLQEMLNGIPGKIWDDETIRDAIARFIEENGRPPKVKELDTVEYLPPHPSIRQQYKMTAGRWLSENYQGGDRSTWAYTYGEYREEDFRNVFVSEYNRIAPESGIDYNKRRTKGTPSWQYIAKSLSVRTWCELKELCGASLVQKGRKGEVNFEVKSLIADFQDLLR